MNLNDLKPAWRQSVLFNAIQRVDQNEILSIIESADRPTISSFPSYLTSAIMFIVLIVCCQGG
ncbi:MAG: hypothetical protein R2804_08825 [Cyclobacteriaceae bacterium]